MPTLAQARETYLEALALYQLTVEAMNAETLPDPDPNDEAAFDAWNDECEASMERHNFREIGDLKRDAAILFIQTARDELARRSPREWMACSPEARMVWDWASNPDHRMFHRSHDRVLALALKMQVTT